jgi:hypothetical protein
MSGRDDGIRIFRKFPLRADKMYADRATTISSSSPDTVSDMRQWNFKIYFNTLVIIDTELETQSGDLQMARISRSVMRLNKLANSRI